MEKHERLFEKYIGFCERVISEWEKKAAADKEHDRLDDYVKGQIKVQVGIAMRDSFKGIYRSIDGE